MVGDSRLVTDLLLAAKAQHAIKASQRHSASVVWATFNFELVERIHEQDILDDRKAGIRTRLCNSWLQLFFG